MFSTIGKSFVTQHISLFALPTRKHTGKIFTYLLLDCSQFGTLIETFSLLFGCFLSLLISCLVGKCDESYVVRFLEAGSMNRALTGSHHDCRVQNWSVSNLPEQSPRLVVLRRLRLDLSLILLCISYISDT